MLTEESEPFHEIDEAFSGLAARLQSMVAELYGACVFGSYGTSDFRPWISDIDILVVYLKGGSEERAKSEIQRIFEEFCYLDPKMRFHSHLFDPWIYSEDEIAKLPIKRMMTYTIPYIKKNHRTLLGKDPADRIPEPSHKEVVESYLSSLIEMREWLDSHRHFLNSSRLDLTMKSVVLRTFNAVRGYLAVRGFIEVSRRGQAEQFARLVQPPQSEFAQRMLNTYEHWIGTFSREEVTKSYEDCLELMKNLHHDIMQKRIGHIR